MDAELLSQIGLPALVLSVILGLFIIFIFGRSKTNNEAVEEVQKEDTNGVKTAPSKRNRLPSKYKKANIPPFTHPLLHTTLKGHNGRVIGLDASINGKYLASCSDDRTVRLWSVKDFGHGNKCVRVNVEFDHAKQVGFSPDSRAFIAGLAIENTVRVFKLGKKDDGVTTCIPIEEDFSKYNKADLINIGVGASASGGSFVMTAYGDTTIHVRDIKGAILHTAVTNLGNNNFAKVSPCGRFFAACGWTPDVKVWSVEFTRNGDYKEVTRAFELKGHTSSVWSFAFNNDSTRMITVSKDGTWRFYDTRVEYNKGQEPYFITSGTLSVCGLSVEENPCMISLSPDASVAAIACLNNISVFPTSTGKVEYEFRDVHTEIITALTFDISGRYFLSAGDKQIRVFHNVLGYKENIRKLKEKLKGESSASTLRDRLQKQIDEAEKNLKLILKKANEV